MTFQPDVVLILTWSPDPVGYRLYSNIKDEMLEEVVCAFIQDQIGKPDKGRVESREMYTIKIGLEVADDTFGVSHDCGSEAFMTGIVAGALRHLGKGLENQPLEEFKT